MVCGKLTNGGARYLPSVVVSSGRHPRPSFTNSEEGGGVAFGIPAGILLGTRE